MPVLNVVLSKPPSSSCDGPLRLSAGQRLVYDPLRVRAQPDQNFWALIKGYGKADDLARIIFAFLAFNLVLQASPWFEYVASKANIADMPSRGDFAEGWSVYCLPSRQG